MVCEDTAASTALAQAPRLARRHGRWGGPGAAGAPPHPGFLPARRSHLLLRPPGHTAPLCIQCGRMFRGAREADAPCRFQGVLGPRATAAIIRGMYDGPLSPCLGARAGVRYLVVFIVAGLIKRVVESGALAPNSLELPVVHQRSLAVHNGTLGKPLPKQKQMQRACRARRRGTFFTLRRFRRMQDHYGEPSDRHTVLSAPELLSPPKGTAENIAACA